jgi:hypothetical protein
VQNLVCAQVNKYVAVASAGTDIRTQALPAILGIMLPAQCIVMLSASARFVSKCLPHFKIAKAQQRQHIVDACRK